MVDFPTVSVIMNCFNGSKYLKEAIDSVYAQTYTDWEIIFWDNASTDNSAEIAKSYDGKLRYFKGDKTVPLYAARNLALHQVRSKYIAFLDCDDMWLPQKLELQVELFENDKKIGLIYSNFEILEIDGSIRSIQSLQPGGQVFRQMLKHYNINIQTAMISKEVLDSLGEWFDNSLNFAGDTDLFLRIAHDWKIKYLPIATARYREHGENLSLKFSENIPVEIEYIIRKFSELYKNFLNEYAVEIADLRIRLQKGLVVSKWKRGENSYARRLVFKHLSGMRYFILLSLLLFFPYRTISFFRNKILLPVVNLYRSIIEKLRII